MASRNRSLRTSTASGPACTGTRRSLVLAAGVSSAPGHTGRRRAAAERQEGLPLLRFNNGIPQDAYIREKSHIRKEAGRAEYFERFPKELYQTEFESWRELQSQNIEFTMKRLREPIERATEIAK